MQGIFFLIYFSCQPPCPFCPIFLSPNTSWYSLEERWNAIFAVRKRRVRQRYVYGDSRGSSPREAMPNGCVNVQTPEAISSTSRDFAVVSTMFRTRAFSTTAALRICRVETLVFRCFILTTTDLPRYDDLHKDTEAQWGGMTAWLQLETACEATVNRNCEVCAPAISLICTTLPTFRF